MRERINRLAKGIIDMEIPELRIQPEKLEGEVQTGELVRKDFVVISENGLQLKGLAYSTNSRVKVLNGSFGGLKSRIGYEINSRHLEYGDVIEGAFWLVTNGGEIQVPYSFRIQAGPSAITLGSLKTPKDFGEMAKQDYDTALRIFEYRDFTEVPFMQDLHIRAVYDGLHGHGNRYGQLEQFLIALGLKTPVELEVDGLYQEYHGVDAALHQELIIRRSGWGYIPISIRIDGTFLNTVKKTVTEEDFQDGICHFPYQINPGGLHKGRNYGAIVLETMNADIMVKFLVTPALSPGKASEAKGNREINTEAGMNVRLEALMENGKGEENGEEAKTAGSRCYARYFQLRLDYEKGGPKLEGLRTQMLEELEQLCQTGEKSSRLSLMQAELYAQAGRQEEAAACLEECREEVLEGRMEKPGLYCLYEYVLTQVQPDKEKRESLNRLLKKYIENRQTDYLIFYLYSKCEEQYFFENPGDMLTRMKMLYGAGCRSPFLYQQALSIWNDAPQLMYGVGSFELQTLHFGARRGAVVEELAVKAARLASVNRYDQPLCRRILKLLYGQYPVKEILEAVCSLMIRGECRRESDFPWYEKALKEQISLTRLYEYFLYSLPSDYKQMIPKEVLLYFSYDHELDRDSRAVLYANILQYVKEDTQIYRDYQKVMGRFAAEQILQSRIDSNLAVIYDAMIYEDMVDMPIARVLPSILDSYRIRVDNPKMRSVVVCYEEVFEEGVYPIQQGAAYVPVFSKGGCLLFQDAYGNRYTDVRHIKTPVMDKPNLEKKCFEVYPDHPMLLLVACRRAAAKEVFEEGDLRIIEKAMAQLRLHPLYKSLLTEQLIRHEQNMTDTGEGEKGKGRLSLAAIDVRILSREQRNVYCEALVSQDYVREAYAMIREYHCQIGAEQRQKLCSRMIQNKQFDQEELLMSLTYASFLAGKADSVMVDYLCERFNGSSRQMYQILQKGIKDRVQTYDLEERLLAQMLFSGETDRIDRVFSQYVKRKKASEFLVKAYFTTKSAAYFLHDVPAEDKVFHYLENMVQETMNKEKLSTIYLLALSKYYAGLGPLKEKQKKLCQSIVSVLLEEGIVLPHFKLLADRITIPEELLDKGILQYIGQKDSRVELEIRILPQEEQFHKDDMKRVYQGIFIMQKVLFDGESMEYRIYEHKGDRRILMKEGSITCGRQEERQEESRFQLLNQMSMCLNLKEEMGLKKTMEEYMKKTAAIESLFGLL